MEANAGRRVVLMNPADWLIMPQMLGADLELRGAFIQLYMWHVYQYGEHRYSAATSPVPMSDREIGSVLAVGTRVARRLVSEMMRRGLLERDNDGYLSFPTMRGCDIPQRDTARTAQAEWRDTRKRILQRDGHTCAYCGQNANAVDHLIPVTKGGGDEDDNLVAACTSCNSSKGAKTPDEFGIEPWWWQEDSDE